MCSPVRAIYKCLNALSLSSCVFKLKIKASLYELDPFFTLSIFTSVKKEQNYIIYIKCMLYIFISIFFNKFLTCTMDVALALKKEQKVLCR